MRNSFPENIEGHSLQVAMIAHVLAVIKNQLFNGDLNAEKIALYAMYHDVNEIMTGDMPTPIKYHSREFAEAYKDVEEISKNHLLSLLPDELKECYKEILFFEKSDKECYSIVKAADRISAYIKCIEEQKAGNKEFDNAAKAIAKSIKNIDREEVKYFMDVFMPGFELNLDEISL